ncbi:MAG: MFS transporter [Furfurilactobacillus sp.]|jgi:MFS family permease|uniref:MFS transporter n=1 Tax=Furfurilactobacillus sp. TaxID=2767911 RepID=UPI00258C2CBA|nr:MFS transporter [Furfurilactobacillus sp.]MCH4011444.1 MFS transporter [Furfurilactobacillus sp.]MCH4037336.1 MFS transporter [Furfurilactobacillus sp.]MCH4116026.1 MFS transporter [Furfurilactobacillus sp.]MCH4133369.1 MFS transporter [Furfurilactobacillus sp.]MCI1339524.1 MFS transporter [Furfurilactobacillus sp.]
MIRKQSWVAKFALLSISLVLTSAYVISVSLPAMEKAFPNVSQASIELLATLPAFSVMIMVLLSGSIAAKIGNKNTTLIGLIIAGAAGIVPAFSNSYPVIFGSRLVLGVGLGMFNSLAVSMIGFMYDGKTKANLMGFRSAFENLGQSLLIFIASYLISISWHATFWVYAAAFIVAIFFYVAVPEPQNPQAVSAKQQGDKIHQHINRQVVGLAIFFFFLVMIHIATLVHLPFIVTGVGYGTAGQAGLITGSMTIIGVLAAISYGQIYKALSRYILPIGLACLSIGVLVMAISHTFWLTLAGAWVFGIAYPLIAAHMFNSVSTVSSPNSETLTAAVLLVGTNSGALLAPYGIKVLGAITHDAVGTKTFFLLGSLLVVITIGAFAIAVTVGSRRQTSSRTSR